MRFLSLYLRWSLTFACVAWAQDFGTEQAGSADVHAEQLANCRAGILDPQATPEGRRRWIDNLLSYGTPQAKALIVELLTGTPDSLAPLAVCEGIARHARSHPARLDGSFIEPLIELLGSDSPDLRGAAAQALADFPSTEVTKRLGAIASRLDAPMRARLSAIDAMVSRVDSREVIAEFMSLLDADVPEITERVIAALQPVARESFGNDVQRWRAWWAQKSRLSEEAWLADRLQLYRTRVNDLQREMDSIRNRELRRQDDVTARMRDFQREIFRGLAPDQKRSRLAEWLAAGEPEVQLVSLELIRGRMADEGRRPNGEVRAALLRLLGDGVPEVRRAVLEIVQNLENEPEIVEAVRQMLPTTHDVSLKQAIFRALGRLGGKEALPDLIVEIANPASPPDCVREAALALGNIAGRSDQRDYLPEASLALKNRYRLAHAADIDLRAALLTAMAGVADPAFAEEFIEAVESDRAAVLRPAIRGLRVTGERSKVARLRMLTADTDAMVRLAAIEAVGELGGEEADLEAVLTRLNPAIEPNDLARDAAWSAYLQLLSGKNVAQRLDRAKRLRDTPDLQIRYLQGLLDELTSANGEAAAIQMVRDELVGVLETHGLFREALPHLKELFAATAPGPATDARNAAGRWLDAALHGGTDAALLDAVTHIRRRFRKPSAEWIAEAVTRYLGSLDLPADRDAVERLHEALGSVEDLPADEEWDRILETIEDCLRQNAPATEPARSP